MADKINKVKMTMAEIVAQFPDNERSAFYCNIGSMLFQAPVAASLAGHRNPIDTIADYARLSTSVPTNLSAQIQQFALEYLIDFAHASTKSRYSKGQISATETLLNKWHVNEKVAVATIKRPKKGD